MTNRIPFNTDLLFSSTTLAVVEEQEAAAPVAPQANLCARCGGSGTYRHFGRCYACHGTGRTGARQPQAVAPRTSSYLITPPEAVTAWINNNTTTNFARSLRAFMTRTNGQLTAAQIAAVERISRENTVEAAPANAVAINAGQIFRAIESAISNGIMRPKLRIGHLIFKLRNGGHSVIYVMDRSNYIGKIVGDAFHRAAACTDEHVASIQTIAANPEAAAVQHGQRTGNCACCGRLLTDPVSVARGIGPICIQSFGWAA